MYSTNSKLFIKNEEQHESALNELIRLEQSAEAEQHRAAIQALGDAIQAYEIAAGHEPMLHKPYAVFLKSKYSSAV